MRKHEIRSAIDALDYLTDCTLATVSDLAGKKSRSQYEFNRQKSIAQIALDNLVAYGGKPTGRAADVLADFEGSVDAWAAQYDVRAS